MISDRAQIDELLGRVSFLGREIIEGVVIKNYGQLAVSAFSSECFAKLVRAEFKERNRGEHTSKKDRLEDFLSQFATEARWEKAFQHLRDEGKLTYSPKDIGPLILEVHKDLTHEEEQNIKEGLWQYFRKQVLGKSTYGLPEWWKKRLVDRGCLELSGEKV